MKLFLDTEFTDFYNPRLISFGVVAENNEMFYAEIERDEWSAHISTFVADKVVPLLGQSGVLPLSRSGAGAQARQWLDTLTTDLLVVADYDQDWKLFEALMRDTGDWPECLENVYEPFDLSYFDSSHNFIGIEARDRWFHERELTRHHALHDACALRDAYSEMRRRRAVG